MKLNDIKLFLNAGYTFFHSQTEEVNRFMQTIQKQFEEEERWKIMVWDFEESDFDKGSIIPFIESCPNYTLIILKNLNWFLKDEISGEVSYDLVTYLLNHQSEFETRDNRKAIFALGSQPFESLPNDLQKHFLQIDFDLPPIESIQKYLDDLISYEGGNEKFTPPSKQEYADIIESCKGLTMKSIENAIAYSIIKNKGKINPKDIGELRKEEIESTVGLKVGNYNVKELLGYQNIKNFVLKSINSPISKGILIIGPPGTGKTHFCRYISTMTNKMLIEAELAEMQGSGLYGQAEQAWAKMIKTVKGIGNCILFFDEIEKGLSATSKDESTDSTGKRSASMLLKFMSEDRPNIYIVATCNSIANLPPEYKRSERWDAIFYLGLPSEKELEEILKFYEKEFDVKRGKFTSKNMQGWSGAEIKTCCRIASMMGVNLLEASKFVIPISKTMAREIGELEKWAEGNAIPASIPIEAKNGKRSIKY